MRIPTTLNAASFVVAATQYLYEVPRDKKRMVGYRKPGKVN